MSKKQFVISMDENFTSKLDTPDIFISDTFDNPEISENDVIYIDILHPSVSEKGKLASIFEMRPDLNIVTRCKLSRDTMLRLKKDGLNYISYDEMYKRIKILGQSFESEESAVFADIIRSFPAIEGTVENGSWANIISAIHENRMNCNLYLKKGKIKKVISFYKGFPVSVKSNRVKELLGRMLVDENKITKEQCDESFKKMKEDNILQGQALIRMGLLSEQELQEALARQWGLKLLDIFYWDSGDYVIKQEKIRPPKFIPPFSFGELILNGLKGLSPGLLQASVNKVLSYYIIPHPIPELRYQPLTYSLDYELFAKLDGKITLSEFIGDNQKDLYVTSAALLLSGNFILSAVPLPVPVPFTSSPPEYDSFVFPSKLLTELEEEWNINEGLEPGRIEYWLRKIHQERFLAEPPELQQKADEWFKKILSLKSYPVIDSENLIIFEIGWNKNYE